LLDSIIFMLPEVNCGVQYRLSDLAIVFGYTCNASEVFVIEVAEDLDVQFRGKVLERHAG
jgi:hypothetical protein